MAISDFLNIPNYVLDFETLSRGPGAFVLTAGLASWWSDGWIQLEGYWRFDLDQPGRSIDSDTVRWWLEVALENPEAAREAFVTGPRVPLRVFQQEVALILAQTPEYTIWSKPQDFDLPILEDIHSALRSPEQLTPHRARNNCRTYWSAAKGFDPGFTETVPLIQHRADHDAWALAETCLRAFQVQSQARSLLDRLRRVCAPSLPFSA